MCLRSVLHQCVLSVLTIAKLHHPEDWTCGFILWSTRSEIITRIGYLGRHDFSRHRRKPSPGIVIFATCSWSANKWARNGLVAVGAEAYYGNIHKRHGKRLRVTKVIPHAKYNEKSFSHDIAVFVVEKPFQFGTNARPICIPTAPVNIAGTDNIVAGWGFIREGGPGTHLLKYTTVTVQPNHICYADYRGFDSRVMYCAYKTATDSCQGDSGGPAMYRVSGGHRYVEVGIVSYGHGCARENVPGVYTRVDVFAPWLKQVVGSYDRAYTTAVPMPLGLSTVSESPLSIQFL
ncbi:trypsin-2 isoform X4 [Rhipicephalus microplus]|uniref:trypsin-2 isoform X4 n=1 Tax=Rhipicephalus microplus TaxID=6941 RepID=UPI003F6ACA1C